MNVFLLQASQLQQLLQKGLSTLNIWNTEYIHSNLSDVFLKISLSYFYLQCSLKLKIKLKIS
jgi:hypothetical protein